MVLGGKWQEKLSCFRVSRAAALCQKNAVPSNGWKYSCQKQFLEQQTGGSKTIKQTTKLSNNISLHLHRADNKQIYIRSAHVSMFFSLSLSLNVSADFVCLFGSYAVSLSLHLLFALLDDVVQVSFFILAILCIFSNLTASHLRMQLHPFGVV